MLTVKTFCSANVLTEAIRYSDCLILERSRTHCINGEFLVKIIFVHSLIVHYKSVSMIQYQLNT